MGLQSGENTSALLAASIAHIKGGDLRAAEAVLSSLLAAEAKNPVALYLLGVTHFERRCWDQAEALFRQALALSPGQPQVILHLVECLRAQQRPAEALELCRAVLRAQPGHVGAWLELAKAQEETGALADAEASYRHITKANSSPEATLNFSRFLSATGRAAEAEALLRAALAPDAARHG